MSLKFESENIGGGVKDSILIKVSSRMLWRLKFKFWLHFEWGIKMASSSFPISNPTIFFRKNSQWGGFKFKQNFDWVVEMYVFQIKNINTCKNLRKIAKTKYQKLGNKYSKFFKNNYKWCIKHWKNIEKLLKMD